MGTVVGKAHIMKTLEWFNFVFSTSIALSMLVLRFVDCVSPPGLWFSVQTVPNFKFELLLKWALIKKTWDRNPCQIMGFSTEWLNQ